jgi:hypothetical protein
MAKLAELDKHKRKHVTNQLKNGEALAEQPMNVKVIKVKSVFNHLSVAKCGLETGEYITIAFKHEKENVDVELPQVVEGIRLTLIPPYYSPKLEEQDATATILMASMYLQQETAEDEQDDMLSEETEDCKCSLNCSSLTPTNHLAQHRCQWLKSCSRCTRPVPSTSSNRCR